MIIIWSSCFENMICKVFTLVYYVPDILYTNLDYGFYPSFNLVIFFYHLKLSFYCLFVGFVLFRFYFYC